MPARLKTFLTPRTVQAALIVCSLIPLLSVLWIMWSYGQNVPANDEWGFSLPIAIETRAGTLSMSDMFVVRAGHRAIFNAIQVVAFTELTDWNVESQLFVTLVSVLVVAVLAAWLAWHTDRAIFFWLILPGSALIFSMRQGLNWLWGVHTGIFFVVAFFLAALSIIVLLPMRWRTLIFAAGLALCAMYSLGHGAVAWPALLLALWLRGYRRWRYLAFWIGVTILALVTFMWGTDIAVGQSDAPHQSIQLTDPIETLRYALAYIAAPMVFRNIGVAQGMAVAGLALFGANFWYLWPRESEKSSLSAWVGMAGYGAGTGFLVALTRTDMGLARSLASFYTTHSNLFWLALIALIAKTVWHMTQRAGRHYPLAAANALMVVLIIGSYFYSNYRTAQITVRVYGHYPLDPIPSEPSKGEQCVRDYLLTGRGDCPGTGLWPEVYGLIDYLAAWKLSVFAEQEPSLLLPASYQSGTPVIVETPWPWMNQYFQDQYLEAVAHEAIFHLTTPTSIPTPILPGNTTSTLIFPDVTLTTHDLPASHADLQTLIGETEQFWYIGVKDSNVFPAEAESILEGYTLVSHTDLGRVEMIHYARLPDTVSDLYRFDDSIVLSQWTLLGDVHVQPCQSIVMQSWWLVREGLSPANTMITLVLSDAATGQGITQQDSIPSSGPLAEWQAERLYPDERHLTIPCDMQPGDYPLLLGLYTINEAGQIENLPVTLSDGTPNGNYGYLTTLFVGE